MVAAASLFLAFFYLITFQLNNSGGQVDKASATGAVDLDLIPGRVKPTTLKLIFIASLLDAQH